MTPIEQAALWRSQAEAWQRYAARLVDTIEDLRAQLADALVERDAAVADAAEQACLADQAEEAASARRYGRRLP